MRFRLTAVLCVVAATVGCGGSDDESSEKPGFEVLDPTAAHFGKTYGEWGAAWWKWIYELPQGPGETCVIPIDDPTGANCGYGQSQDSDVFFLAGNYGSVSVRSACVVPAGKTIVFPILNYAADNGGVPASAQLDEAGLIDAVHTFEASVDVSSLFATVDGKSLGAMESLLVPITKYSYTLPAEPNSYSCLGMPGVTGPIEPAFSGGYWVMISGLTPGKHVIHFGGATTTNPPFELDVTYNLTIE